MNFIAQKAKVFAVLSLIFVNCSWIAAQGGSAYTLPIGTKIRLSMDAGISSKVSSVNDTFTTTVAKPISVENVVVLPFGTVIEGRVTQVSSAGFGRKNGQMLVRFETIRFPDNRKRTIDGILVDELRPASTKALSLFSIFGGSAAGALIGAAAGKQTGALAGAGIGAGAGTVIALARRGRDVSIKSEQEFEIQLKSEVTLPARDY